MLRQLRREIPSQVCDFGPGIFNMVSILRGQQIHQHYLIYPISWNVANKLFQTTQILQQVGHLLGCHVAEQQVGHERLLQWDELFDLFDRNSD